MTGPARFLAALLLVSAPLRALSDQAAAAAGLLDAVLAGETRTAEALFDLREAKGGQFESGLSEIREQMTRAKGERSVSQVSFFNMLGEGGWKSGVLLLEYKRHSYFLRFRCRKLDGLQFFDRFRVELITDEAKAAASFEPASRPILVNGLLLCGFLEMGALAFSAWHAFRHARRKWLWAFSCLTGIGKLAFYWVPGPAGGIPIPAGWQLMNFQLFGFGLMSGGAYQPYVMVFAYPVGAMAYWLLWRKGELGRSSR